MPARRGIAIAAAVIAAQSAVPARGYSPPWQQANVSTDPRLSEADRGRAVLQDYGTCILHQHRSEALEFLKMSPDTPQAGKAGADLSGEECLASGELRFSATLLRGALFQALYRQLITNLKATAIAAPASDERWLYPMDTRFGLLQRFGECAVTLDPSDSRAILLARVASPEEKAGYAALSPHLGDCIAPGAKISFDKASLGGLLAEALYRMSTPGGAAGK